jgi:hypothetical protein
MKKKLVFAFLAVFFISGAMAGEFAGDTNAGFIMCGSDLSIFTTGSDVIEADNQNFQKKVIDTGSLTLVSFYAPWLVQFYFRVKV